MKILKKKPSFKFLAYTFALLFAGAFQLAEGAVDSTNARLLKQNLTTVEKQIRELQGQIQNLRQKVDPAVLQTQKLQEENDKIQKVLKQRLSVSAEFPWIRLSRPQTFHFTVTSMRDIKRTTAHIKANIDQLIDRHLNSFSETVRRVEKENRNLQAEYKKAKESHEERRRQARAEQARQNQSPVNHSQGISSPELARPSQSPVNHSQGISSPELAGPW